jgi:hypothetical protein
MKLAIVSVLLAGCAAAADPAAKAKGGAPVIVELFTSQGCSSCPPADRLLSRIAKDGALDGRAVLPLAFHVDYWNDLGWADPFSRAAWSDRQGAYAHAMRANGVYTPQAVVAGAADALGSDRDAIAKAVAATPVQVAIDAKAARASGALHVTATAPAGADVWVAVWEDGLGTDVRRGENAGAHLADDHVVRALVKVAAAGASGSLDVPLDPSWKRMGAVAFAQRPGDLAIVGATVLSM